MTEVWDYNAQRHKSFADSLFASRGFGVGNDISFWPKYSMDEPFSLPVNVTGVNLYGCAICHLGERVQGCVLVGD